MKVSWEKELDNVMSMWHKYKQPDIWMFFLHKITSLSQLLSFRNSKMPCLVLFHEGLVESTVEITDKSTKCWGECDISFISKLGNFMCLQFLDRSIMLDTDDIFCIFMTLGLKCTLLLFIYLYIYYYLLLLGNSSMYLLIRKC